MKSKHPKMAESKASIRSTTFLRRKVNNYRKTREEKVKIASKEAFGLTKEVKKKLNRMFELENV